MHLVGFSHVVDWAPVAVTASLGLPSALPVTRHLQLSSFLSTSLSGLPIDDIVMVFADRDGVVVVPQAVEEEALTRAWNKVHEENITRDAIKNGMGAVEAYEKYGVL